MFVLDFSAESGENLQQVELEKATKVCPVILSPADARCLAPSAISEGDIWVSVSDGSIESSELFALLDAGASKLVLSCGPGLDEDMVNALGSFPADRLILRLPSFSPDSFVAILKATSHLVSGIMLDLAELKVSSLTATGVLDSVYKAAKGRGPGFFSFVLSANHQFDLQWTASIDKMGVDVVIPKSLVSFPLEKRDVVSTLDLGTLLSSFLVTDRPDGLFSTIVVDEQGIALGLCYSSAESIREAIRTGDGVYFSRSRGLWHKGSTSGATQKLISIALDCDRDALRFTVRQKNPGFCHFNTRTCFGASTGLGKLAALLEERHESAPAGSYTNRLFEDQDLLKSKIMEEAEELCDATSKQDIAWEAADLIYFALVKCTAAGVSLSDIEKQLDRRSKKVTRRAGDGKPKWDQYVTQKSKTEDIASTSAHVEAETVADIKMKSYSLADLSPPEFGKLLLRPIIDTKEIMSRVEPIMKQVRERGDQALLELTAKFDSVTLEQCVLRAPFDPSLMELKSEVRQAIDQAYANIYKFHDAQLDTEPLIVETMPGVTCSRFVRPIQRVGLYVPGGSAVLPSSTLMLGVPAKVAGCTEIVVATPPRKDGSVAPEVMYVAHKIGASCVLVAGGAQAVAAMAYGTESVPKVDKICGPGNQYVTAAKMIAQSDSSAMIGIDMPAGPSELLVIADKTCNPAYVASDLLSQAEHGGDSQVVLVAVDLSDELLASIEQEVSQQGLVLPRVDVVRISIPKSFILKVSNLKEALDFSNEYSPEHLILHLEEAAKCLDQVQNAGSIFVGHWSPESCGDYASGTNHTLPTYGFARMYSGVNTHTFVKHITSQELTKEGLDRLGDTVTTLAEVEGLEAHRNAVAIRLKDIRNSKPN